MYSAWFAGDSFRAPCWSIFLLPIFTGAFFWAFPDLLIWIAEAKKGPKLPSLVWMAPFLAGGGYSSEAISYALALGEEYRGRSAKLGLRQFAEHPDRSFMAGVPADTSTALRELFRQGGEKKKWKVAVCHATPDTWHKDGAFGWGMTNPCPPPGAKFTVGRTMYETDRLPKEWVPRINDMDEVWVPSAFAVEQFASSGVDRGKIVVVPEAVDTNLFDPDKYEPLELPGVRTKRKAGDAGEKIEDFRFLSVFKWEARKGWDVLLRAFFEEFNETDPVVLYLKTKAFHDKADFTNRINKFVDGLKSARHPLPRYKILDKDLALKELPKLYRAAHAFVLPSRGEGWGRPHVEAMSMGLPVIATNWSGSTEFLTDETALPLRIDGLSKVTEGQTSHFWADPSVAHLRELMRWCVEHREEAADIGARARKDMIERFSPRAVLVQHVLPQLYRIADGQKSQKKDAQDAEL